MTDPISATSDIVNFDAIIRRADTQQQHGLAVTKNHELVQVEKKNPNFFGRLFGRRVRYVYRTISSGTEKSRRIKAQDLLGQNESRQLLSRSLDNFIVRQMPSENSDFQQYREYMRDVVGTQSKKETPHDYVGAQNYLTMARHVMERVETVKREGLKMNRQSPNNLRAELARPLDFDPSQDFPVGKGAFFLLALNQAKLPEREAYQRANLETIRSLMNRHIDEVLSSYEDDPAVEDVKSYFQERTYAIFNAAGTAARGVVPLASTLRQIESALMKTEGLMQKRLEDSSQGNKLLSSHHPATRTLYGMLNSRLGVAVGGIIWEPEVIYQYNIKKDMLRAPSMESIPQTLKQERAISPEPIIKEEGAHSSVPLLQQTQKPSPLPALNEGESQSVASTSKEQKEASSGAGSVFSERAVSGLTIKKKQTKKKKIKQAQADVKKTDGARVAGETSPSINYSHRPVNVDLNAPPPKLETSSPSESRPFPRPLRSAVRDNVIKEPSYITSPPELVTRSKKSDSASAFAPAGSPPIPRFVRSKANQPSPELVTRSKKSASASAPAVSPPIPRSVRSRANQPSPELVTRSKKSASAPAVSPSIPRSVRSKASQPSPELVSRPIIDDESSDDDSPPETTV